MARSKLIASLVLSCGAILALAAPAQAAIDLYIEGEYQQTYETEDEARKAAIDWRSQGATPLCVYSSSGNMAPCPKSSGKPAKVSHRGGGRVYTLDPAALALATKF